MTKRSSHIRLRLVLSCVLLAATLAGCASTTVPRRQSDVCQIFGQNPSWRAAVRETERKWGAPAHVQMAIIWKESSFRHDARPPKKKVFFGLVSWGRVSSAYGYAQALDGTWKRYLAETGRSQWLSNRSNFADASDFVGWYMRKTHRTNGVLMHDAVAQYLNYHEGQGGYRRGTYRSKPWLVKAAQRVATRAERYRRQLEHCPN